MTCVANKVAWYSPYVRFIRGGASARSDGVCTGLVVGRVC